MASQRQPHQRSMSGTSVNPKPPPHRTLSQQFRSSSPTRRNAENLVDLTLEGTASSENAGLGPYSTMPRNGGSRLKLEISKDSKDSNDAGRVDSPKQTPDATSAWKPSQPPRGRPQLHFDVPSISNLSSRTAQERRINEAPIKPMPLPVRPGQHPPPSIDHSRDRVLTATAVKKDARPKAYVLEVPAVAPHFPASGHADFFPWTGSHPEDQFSEHVIRHGFFDKPQIALNETGSAKASLLPCLKHKTGLQTLSSLFIGVLTQRRAHGQITSSSTFKPPPRVTVTDTKREMWLKDLANPTISLRRLSRSIPHGVRGKVLLDQSLSKNIPIERAVWLAKCVGANELRSFRRKGVSGAFAMGGEAKWIRDFTVCVEQFVEHVVGLCGEKEFRSKISYAIRLAAHFYSEYLLDREHYMDWLVSSLENSPQARLPIWLLITQLYWRDLLRYRKHGRRLSAALLNQLSETLNQPDCDILAPLSERLKSLLKGLMISNPEGFVAPQIWTKHRSAILSSLASDDERFLPVFTAIDRRNDRLNAPGAERKPTARRRLVRLLDATLFEPFANDLPNQSWHMDDDKAMLVQAVLEWSTSSYRPGNTKVSAGARILRHWSRSGADVTEATLNFLDSKNCELGRSKPAFYHLISELARSDHFSTPIYLQWLIARGSLSDVTDLAEDGPCATRLLAELPLHNLSESMIGLRRTLLYRAGFGVDSEEEQTRACLIAMERSLPGMQANIGVGLEPQDLFVTNDITHLLAGLSRTSKAEIGLWLRQKVGLQMVQPTIPPLDNWDDLPVKNGTSAITAAELNSVRQYFELIDDYSMLADVLKIVTSSNDAEVLASCADTLNLHLETFAAIGALKGLFDILLSRLRSLTEDLDSLPRVLLVSMSDLASRMPELRTVACQLTQQLVRSDRKTAADACSPVSDHMAGVLQTAEADFSDEIEKVLASGNSMDQATLERLFQRIALRLEISWEKSPEQQRSCGLLLTRLRTFDVEQFDVLMAAWVNRFQQMESRPSMMQVFGPLISFGCLALHAVIASSAPVIENDANSPKASRISGEALALLIAPSNIPDVMTVEEAYRLRIKQSHMQKDHLQETLSVIHRAVEDFDPFTEGEARQSDLVKNLLRTQGMHELLQRLVLLDTNLTVQTLVVPLLQGTKSGAARTIISMVDELLMTKQRNEVDESISTSTVLNLADDLTLPFCQLKLASIFSTMESTSEATECDGTGSLREFDIAIESAVAAGNTAWTCIIPLLDISIAQHLRQRAEIEFLALLPSPKTGTAGEMSKTQNFVAYAENLLHIIDVAAYSISATAAPPSFHLSATLAPDIVATLNNIWILLSTIQFPDMKDTLVSKWLPLLLSFTTIHIAAFDPAKAGYESRAKAALAMAAIMLELQALDNNTEAVNELIEQTFDLALHLVGSLPDDMRQQCVRSLRDAVSNPRISYIFSFAPNPSEWLMLSQKERVHDLPGAGAGSRGGSGGGGGGATPDENPGPDKEKEKLVPFPLRRWEMLGEPTPNVGENDTSLSLTLFGARRA